MESREMKIIDGAPTAAIYTRKSKATESGESIENQISRCIALCEAKGWGYIVYIDYDVSGKNTDRPDFQEMMNKVKNKHFDFVVVYHVYRFARNMKDFTVLIDELQDLEVGFISISQQFDTSTPMGRAAMYMTAVFGQLERENTAEQVRDNMIYLAGRGRWNGGPIPYGFDTYSELIEYRQTEGKKKVTYLTINEKESEVVKEFFKWYKAPGGSIRNVTTKANELGYRTKNNALWAHNQISRILQNPLYCIADSEAYNYFKNNTEVNMVDNKESYNGENGLMYYNRRRPYKKTTRLRDESEWILSVGEHKGFIPGELFSQVQLKLDKNKNSAPRSGQSLRSPLVGLVKCGRCGSSMSIFGSPRDSNDRSKGYYHYFRCLTREQKARILCDNSNARADKLEDLILTNIITLMDNESSLKSILEATNNDIEDRRSPLLAKKKKLQGDLTNIDSEIENLVDALTKDILPEILIKKKYKELENKKVEIKKELNKISFELNSNYVEKYDYETVAKYIKNLKHSYRHLSFEEKKLLLHGIVKEVEMNRNKVKLTLYFLPGKSIQDLDIQADWLCTDKHVLAKHQTLTLECIYNNEETDLNSLPESTLGERLRKTRLLSNLTIKDLSRLSCTSENTISNIEKSRAIPNITTLNKLCQALNVNTEYLLGTDSWPEKTQSEIIYKYRMKSGLSQRDLAERCNLHYSTIRDYENGRIANPDTLKIIYHAIGYCKKSI